MRKQLLFAFILLGLAGKAQQPVVFLPDGAKWNHLFINYGATSLTPVNGQATYAGTMTVDNGTVKVVHHPIFYKGSCAGCEPTTTYIKQRGDTIFMKNVCLAGWQVLYNFATPAGGTWTVALGNPVSVICTVLVNSVQTVTINSMSLRQLTTTVHIPGGPGFSGASYQEIMTERIGASYIFYFNPGNCDGLNFNRFLCYEDNTFPQYQPNSAYSCDYATGIRKYNEQSAVSIAPNPAGNSTTIRTIVGADGIVITDVFGRIVQTSVPMPANSASELDLSQLQQGIYFLRVINKGLIISKQKLIKE